MRRAIVFLAALSLLQGVFGQEAFERQTVSEIDLYRSGRWEFSFESAYTFHLIQNPFHLLYEGRLGAPNPLPYHLATQLLAVRYRLTNAQGPWFLRGSLQSSATLVGTAIISGPESYFAGLALGLRYDFAQAGARVVPFFEIRGGPGVTDSRGYEHAQQQDLVFTYLLSAGLRYDLSRKWSVTLGAVDQHLSNAYLAPRNYGFDSLGITVGAFAHF